MVFVFLSSSSHSNCKSLSSFLVAITFMSYLSKVIISRNSENFLSNSDNYINTIDNPSVIDFSQESAGTCSMDEHGCTCVVGLVMVADKDWWDILNYAAFRRLLL
jgi:hypothetical protein